MTLIEVGETQAAEGSIDPNADAELSVGRAKRGEVWRRFRKNRLAMVGLGFILLLALVALFAPLIAQYTPTELAGDTKQPVSLDHWFGTDRIGRDLFTRVIYGARVSLRIGVAATVMSLIIGIAVGATAGFFGGTIDNVLMRFTDVLLAIPYVVLAVAIATVIGKSENSVILIIGITGWLGIARIVRSSFLSLKQLEYVEAARALGFSRSRIMFRHIMPNALQPMIVYGTITVGSVILTEAALSFLGVGPQDPTPAWGLMVADAKGLMVPAPHVLFFPGAAIALTVMAFVFVGDGLRDALDPKLK
jgi:ABC-type dipeptide/oligopeptide/nickel transport system permease subunit